jgi:hypothetical protein
MRVYHSSAPRPGGFRPRQPVEVRVGHQAALQGEGGTAIRYAESARVLLDEQPSQ